REDSGLVCRLRMDVNDPRFLVVDPDDGVRHDLILSAQPIVELRDGRCYRVGILDDTATSSPCACFAQYITACTARRRRAGAPWPDSDPGRTRAARLVAAANPNIDRVRS